MNKHRSPNNKQSTSPNSLTLRNKYLYGNQSPYSSKQQSTKQQFPSKEQIMSSNQEGLTSNVKHAFFKTKESEAGLKNLHTASSETLIKYSSQRQNKRKGRDRYDIRQKKSSEKYQQYFDLKNDNLRGVKQRPKFFKKVSDSEDSQLSHNSKNSVNSEGNIKFKYPNAGKIISEGYYLHQHSNVDNKFIKEDSQQKYILDKYWTPKNLQVGEGISKESPLKSNPNYVAEPSLVVTSTRQQQLNGRSSVSPQPKQKYLGHKNYFNSKIIERKPTPLKYKGLPQSPHKQKPIWSPRQRCSAAELVPSPKDDGEHSVSFSKQKSQFFNPDLPVSKYGHDNNRYAHYNNDSKFNSTRQRVGSQINNNYFTLFSSSQSYSFIILSKLVEHKQTTVYLCLEARMKQVYCLKKCKINQDNLNQLIVEHKVGSFCNHPNLVKTFTSFFDKSFIYILMEYMQGGTLLNIKNNINQKIDRISSNNARQTLSRPRQITVVSKNKTNQAILGQILEGVKYLHSKKIIHRDIKPENVYASNGNYKIGDFGSSSFNNQQQYVGTLDYVAPEIMLKQKYTETIDIWSVGCIAFELEVGRPPFYHNDRHQTVRRIVNVEYDISLISNLDLKNLISMMLVKNGLMRISAAEALKHPYFSDNHKLPGVRNRI